jgi:hypothetical protein
MTDLQTELDGLFQTLKLPSPEDQIRDALLARLASWGIEDNTIRVLNPLPPLSAVVAGDPSKGWSFTVNTPEKIRIVFRWYDNLLEPVEVSPLRRCPVPVPETEKLVQEINAFLEGSFRWTLEQRGIEMHPAKVTVLGALAYTRIHYSQPS